MLDLVESVGEFSTQCTQAVQLIQRRGRSVRDRSVTHLKAIPMMECVQMTRESIDYPQWLEHRMES